MLKIDNIKVYWDFEIPIINSFDVIIFGPNPYTSQDLSQIKKYTHLTLEEIHNKNPYCVGLNYKQWCGFINEWISNSTFHKLWDWSVKDWINEYIEGTRHFSDIMGEDDYTAHDSHFRSRQCWFLRNLPEFDVDKLKYKEYKNPIIFDVVNPEYSLMVEDYIWCKFNNETSQYEKYVENRLKINKEKWEEFMNAYNGYGYTIIGPNHNKFFDFYFPMSDEKIKSNWLHIKKCLTFLEN